jgi:hypothetical protein
MGAETTVYVRVRKLYEEWIEVSAVTLQQAEEIALDRDDVVEVVESAYDKPTDNAACICETHGHPIEKRWQHDRWCPQYLEPADESANPQGGG